MFAGRYDVAVIGTGPAGVSAAITAKVRNKSVLLLGSAEISDKVAKAHSIQNYPGLPDIPGAELAKKLREHLDQMGIEITDRRVTMIYAMGDFFSLQIDQEFVEATSVILAIGVSFGKPLPGEDENLGRGVSYCATCDGALYRGKEAVIVGYAPKEEADARFLSELVDKVTYIPVYKKDEMPSEGTELFPGIANIEVVCAKPEAIERRDGRMVLTTDLGEIVSDGIFLLRESVSPGKLVPGLELDGNHVKVDRKMASNLPGLFAAGDITGTPYQYIKAAGEGNVAALSAVSFIDSKK
ncbi:MAG: NAD(P)/FAD-dependent oxidoreductase [Lachnospiraceae bacterium]|nr:NAD(P)/FAD-dependent oxidoreductase [Lachnospiraceae bacterium]